MTSKIYHNMTAAANSASQKQQLINNSKKARGRYEPPTKASQLNDWAARCAEKQLVTQFQRTSRSVSPVPETNTTNWAKKSNILVMRDDTQIPDRFTSTKHRNTVFCPEYVRLGARRNAERISRKSLDTDCISS